MTPTQEIAFAAGRVKLKRLLSEDSWRLKRGYLLAHEQSAVITDLRNGRPYIDIQLDWLLSKGQISKIAAANGLARQKQRRRVSASVQFSNTV